MDNRGTVNLDQVRAYTQRHGARQTEECLRKLGIYQTFYNAYSTTVGKELLSTINAELVRLSEMILCSPESTDDNKAMYRAFSHIAQSWAQKINTYENLVRTIQESELPE